MSLSTEMYELLKLIAVYSSDNYYATQAEELVRKVKENL